MIYIFSKFIALRTLNINSTMINEKLYIPKLILLNLLKNKTKILKYTNKKPENFTMVQKNDKEKSFYSTVI